MFLLLMLLVANVEATMASSVKKKKKWGWRGGGGVFLRISKTMQAVPISPLDFCELLLTFQNSLLQVLLILLLLLLCFFFVLHYFLFSFFLFFFGELRFYILKQNKYLILQALYLSLVWYLVKVLLNFLNCVN